jgi:hypothetical protein
VTERVVEMRNIVELAGNATEVAGVVLIAGGFMLAASRWLIIRGLKNAAPYRLNTEAVLAAFGALSDSKCPPMRKNMPPV